MSLFVVATSIGDPGDISFRAVQCLKDADLIIGEERKEVSRLLKSLGLQKPFELLNEHSRETDFEFLAQQCADKNVVLVSDCGTPGFCDPGSELVQLCRRKKITVKPIPGASSLMALISVAGFRLNQFVFFGFLPAKQELRSKALSQLKSERRPSVVMDTPYRLTKLLDELQSICPEHRCVIGFDLTLPSEKIIEGSIKEIRDTFQGQKGEFILLLMPN